MWVRQLGTTEDDIGMDLVLDSSDNIYVTGASNGPIGGNINNGLDDILLIKFDASGNALWSELLGSPATDRGSAIIIDNNHNILITGSTTSNFDGNLGYGKSDAVIIKYNEMGEKLGFN